MRRCSTSLAIKEMKIETKMSYDFTSTSTAKTKKKKIVRTPKADEDL